MLLATRKSKKKSAEYKQAIKSEVSTPLHALERSAVDEGVKAVASSFDVLKTVLAKLRDERGAGNRFDMVEAAQKNVDQMIENLRDKIRRREPAVPVEQSIQRDHLISLIDGSRVTMLKWHLKEYGLTMDQYRTMFDLPSNYPTVAPARSEMLSKRVRKIQPWKK